MANWAKTTDNVRDNGFGDDREGNIIQGAIIHHVAGTNGENYVANQNPRNSHPTYHINRDGKVTGIVHPNRQPFSMGHTVDNIVITFEIDNERTGGDWPITDKSMNALIEVLLDHEKQSPRNGFAVNQRGVNQKEFFIGYHSQYVQTECPGPYIRNRIPEIVKELNRRRAGGGATAPSKPQTAPASSTPDGLKVGPVVRSGRDWAYRRPQGELAKRVARALIKRGRLPRNYNNDGDPRAVFDRAVQRTLNHSRTFEGPTRRGLVDGRIERGGCYGIQNYADKFGDYNGPKDGRPEVQSWVNFALGLERP